jgi:thiamine-phosphate pyrophosphorylase
LNCSHDRKKLVQALRLYGVWSGDATLPHSIERVRNAVEAAIEGGTTAIQLRVKNLPTVSLAALAAALLPLTGAHGIPLIVNDSLEAAIASGSDGLHIGQSDGDPAEARRKLGPEKILGVSVQTVGQAIKAQRAGADYLGVGAIFPTGTKLDADAVPIQELERICKAVSIPVVAIGGITEQNAGSLADTGIAGIAVVSALFGNMHSREPAEIRDAATRLAAVTLAEATIAPVKLAPVKLALSSIAVANTQAHASKDLL